MGFLECRKKIIHKKKDLAKFRKVFLINKNIAEFQKDYMKTKIQRELYLKQCLLLIFFVNMTNFLEKIGNVHYKCMQKILQEAFSDEYPTVFASVLWIFSP